MCSTRLQKFSLEETYGIENEICRILDNRDEWKEVADRMQYSVSDINDIEVEARRQSCSPAKLLLARWGQQNHYTDELFVILYKMKHMVALNVLAPCASSKFKVLLKRHESGNTRGKNGVPDCNGNVSRNEQDRIDAPSSDSLPLPLLLIEKGVKMPSSSNRVVVKTDPSTTESTTDNVSNTNEASSRKAEFLDSVNAIPCYNYAELEEATGNWSSQNVLGQGGFGDVYKGELKSSPVAVKRLKTAEGQNQFNSNQYNRELVQEMCLNKYRHDNILALYGYSQDGPHVCLVYQLMAGGSLQDRLRCKGPRPPLTWPQRYRIAHGVARGLQYLHRMAGTPLIHGDIKPANILLDNCCQPKIGDFGLARKGTFGEDKSHMYVSKVHGTRPYLPAEYLHDKCLSPAVDVFSYGVVVLETATGQPPYDRRREAAARPLHEYVRALADTPPPRDMAEAEDPRLMGTDQSNPMLCREFVSIGLHCTKSSRMLRPTMFEVFQRLNGLEFPGKKEALEG